MVVTLWATKEARNASAEFARDAAKKVVKQVASKSSPSASTKSR